MAQKGSELAYIVQLLVEVSLCPDGRLILPVGHEEGFQFREARLVEDGLDELGAALEVGSGVRGHLQLPLSEILFDNTSSMRLKFKAKSSFLAIRFSPDGSGTLPVLDPLVVELFQLLLALLQVSDRLPRIVALLVPNPLNEVESAMLKT